MLRSRQERKPFPLNIWLIVAIGGVTAIGGVGAWFTSPRLDSFTPQGSESSSLSPITLRFTQAMDHYSVESRFHLEPPVAGAFSWQGNTLLFTPVTEFTAGNVRVSLASGATGENGLPMWFGREWQFTVVGPRMAFLFKRNEVANLWVYPIGEDRLIQMTTEGIGVGEYAISPDGTQIVYSALRADGGADLKRVSRDAQNVSQLIACPNELCAFPTFSFDGKLLAFERTRLKQTNTRLEVIDLTTLQTVTPPLDPLHVTRSPLFARDGRLAYLNLSTSTTVIYDFKTKTSVTVPNTSGEIGTWSPDGKYLVFAEIFTNQADNFYSHLRRATVGSSAFQDLSVEPTVEDGSPVYAPNGEWLAFGRKQLIQEQWSPGKQLWLMKADGSEVKPITNDPLYNHSAFAWSPNGKTLLYMRFDVTDPVSAPQIWQVQADGTGVKKLITGGYLPQWLP